MEVAPHYNCWHCLSTLLKLLTLLTLFTLLTLLTLYFYCGCPGVFSSWMSHMGVKEQKHFWILLNTIKHYWPLLRAGYPLWTLLNTFEQYWTLRWDLSLPSQLKPWRCEDAKMPRCQRGYKKSGDLTKKFWKQQNPLGYKNCASQIL